MILRMSESLRIIGTSVLRKEGIPKVTGRAVYLDDLRIENCLYGRTVRSSVPHGIIKQIRFSPAFPWKDFVIVLPEDIPGLNGVTLIDAEQPFLASREIQHLAEPIALIAHEDKELVDRALPQIEVDVEELPAVLTMEEAFERGDVFKSYAIENGDLSTKWREADYVLGETYRTGAQEHLYIEPQAIVASAVQGESVTIWGSMQCPYYVQKAVAPLFDLPAERVRIVQTETGGGFGGKEEYPNIIAGHAALLSWKAGGRAVKMIYNRREDMLATTKRHPSKTRIKAGFKRDGTLVALDIDILLDGGAYATLSSVVLSRATLHSWGPYKCDTTRIQSRVLKTNSVPHGAFRGFGAPQAIFAIEMHMNRAAAELGIDPAELRRRNFLRQGDRMPTGQVITDALDLDRLMDRALELSGYREKRIECERTNAERGEKRKGIGLSLFFHGSGFTGSGEVRLASQLSMRVTEQGGVEVLASNVEYGQGTNTIFAQIAAETCGISPDLVEIHQPDTRSVPNSGPTVASRTTMIVGKLVQRAAQELRRRLNEPQDFSSAAQQYVMENGELMVTVQYEPPAGVEWDEKTYRGEAYAAYSWSCDVAEVEVDMTDYAARVTNFVSTVECGRVLNPVLAEAQIEGGIAQGIGFALYEDVVLERGAMKNNQFTNYIIPTTADTPDIHVEFVEFPSTNPGPYHAKGIGEMPIDGPAPAIASAVAHALGGRFINEIPLVPERIMRKMESS
jgi:CO/xanthine dehydrogenase Mo-binding subunit